MLLESARVKEYRLANPEEQIRDYLTGLQEQVSQGVTEPSETVIKTKDGRDIFISVLDPQKVFAEHTAMVVEAHPDDAALAGGVANISADIGMGVSYITLTDGSARELEGFADGKELAATRLRESVNAASVAAGAIVINLGYPDADLTSHQKSAAKEVAAIMEILNPEYVIATHPGDAHRDHSAGYKVAKRARRSTGASLYATDTQTGRTKWGWKTRLTHYIPISSEAKVVRDESFKAHASQRPGSIPVEDEVHVHQVDAMPEVHGRKVGREFAIGLRKTAFDRDRLRTRMEANGMEVIRPRSPRVLFEKIRDV